jgi:hypothetical protein
MALIGIAIDCHDEGGLCPRPLIYPDYGFQRQGVAVVVSCAMCDEALALGLCAGLAVAFGSPLAAPEGL